jgi:hypothetical protein
MPLSSLLIELFTSGPVKRFYPTGAIGVLMLMYFDKSSNFPSTVPLLSILKPTTNFAYAEHPQKKNGRVSKMYILQNQKYFIAHLLL